YSERPRSVGAMPQPAFSLLDAGNPSASTLLLLCWLWEPQCSVSGGSGPSEKVFNEFWKPSRGRLGPRRGRKLLDDHKAVDLLSQILKPCVNRSSGWIGSTHIAAQSHQVTALTKSRTTQPSWPHRARKRANSLPSQRCVANRSGRLDAVC